jgi:hypothetical protein
MLTNPCYFDNTRQPSRSYRVGHQSYKFKHELFCYYWNSQPEQNGQTIAKSCTSQRRDEEWSFCCRQRLRKGVLRVLLLAKWHTFVVKILLGFGEFHDTCRVMSGQPCQKHRVLVPFGALCRLHSAQGFRRPLVILDR